MRGVGGYNVAIVEGMREWGVSVHFVDEQLDTGDLVLVERFPLDPDTATALSLDVESQERLYRVFRSVLDRLLAGEDLPRTPQGDGRYVSRQQLEELRRIPPGADAAEIERRARAFWYPPWPGATVELAGRPFTLVDDATLRALAAERRDVGVLP
jgi:methionyl-tRNA formyltransferase